MIFCLLLLFSSFIYLIYFTLTFALSGKTQLSHRLCSLNQRKSSLWFNFFICTVLVEELVTWTQYSAIYLMNYQKNTQFHSTKWTSKQHTTTARVILSRCFNAVQMSVWITAACFCALCLKTPDWRMPHTLSSLLSIEQSCGIILVASPQKTVKESMSLVENRSNKKVGGIAINQNLDIYNHNYLHRGQKKIY